MVKRICALLLAIGVAWAPAAPALVAQGGGAEAAREEAEAPEGEAEPAYETVNQTSGSATLTDGDGNKYSVTSTPSRSGYYTPTVKVGFSITSYAGTSSSYKNTVNSKKKYLSATAKVILRGETSSTTLSSSTVSFTGSSSSNTFSLSSRSKEIIYNAGTGTLKVSGYSKSSTGYYQIYEVY